MSRNKRELLQLTMTIEGAQLREAICKKMCQLLTLPTSMYYVRTYVAGTLQSNEREYTIIFV